MTIKKRFGGKPKISFTPASATMPDVEDLDDDRSCTTPSTKKHGNSKHHKRIGVKSPSRILKSPNLQNPIHMLDPNNDAHEKALARAARASNCRRKSVVAEPPPDRGNLFDKDQLVDLFNNCIKLATENKINVKNTWDLGLIDHLSELIRVDSDDIDAETNFQKASCTLEAGVKIYSLRVDSTHSEAYKLLGGINRATKEDDKDVADGSDEISGDKQDDLPKKDQQRKLSPSSTLESSFESLNVKKIDVAFTVDPLYHQTSAQFDEGGAKGLLLSNLGVYGNCNVLFDSFEKPGKNIPCEAPFDKSGKIDLLFARDEINQMVANVPLKNEISPTLRDIVNLFDGDNRRPLESIPSHTTNDEQDYTVNNDYMDWEDNETGQCDFDSNDQINVDDDVSHIDSNITNHQEEEDDGTYTSIHASDDTEERLIAGFLTLGLGFNSKTNSWAGPDHWKYRKTKVLDQTIESTVESSKIKKPTNRKQMTSEIEFTNLLETNMENIFAPPKHSKLLLLPTKKNLINITLPEDCHYQPENLIKLFLLPDVMCLGKRTKVIYDDARQEYSTYDPTSDWNNDDAAAANDQFDDDNDNTFGDDVNDIGDLVCQPRQINKIEVTYDKFSKQVDVHALKGILWNTIKQSTETSQTEFETPVTFTQILGHIANESAAPALHEISPHLSFICLLHLANEHNLRICGTSTLNELSIFVPKNH